MYQSEFTNQETILISIKIDYELAEFVSSPKL